MCALVGVFRSDRACAFRVLCLDAVSPEMPVTGRAACSMARSLWFMLSGGPERVAAGLWEGEASAFKEGCQDGVADEMTFKEKSGTGDRMTRARLSGRERPRHREREVPWLPGDRGAGGANSVVRGSCPETVARSHLAPSSDVGGLRTCHAGGGPREEPGGGERTCFLSRWLLGAHFTLLAGACLVKRL